MRYTLSIIALVLIVACIVHIPVGNTFDSMLVSDSKNTFEDNAGNYGLATDPFISNVKVALYYELNGTSPSYAIGAMNTNYSVIFDILLTRGYNVTMLTSEDILYHNLVLANFDVVILADNCPRESIVNHVKEFWLGGGGILSYDSSISYLGYAGILPRENESISTGYDTFWRYIINGVGNISARTPVTQSYEIAETPTYFDADYATYYWDALMTTSIANDLTMLATHSNNMNHVMAVSMDPTDKGGKVVQIGIPIDKWAPDWEDMMCDAIDWLAPHPKARIGYDYSHQPRLSIDSWDEFSTVWDSTNSYGNLRDACVVRKYTFDKFYPSASGNFTEERLANYDVMIICWPDLYFTESERFALLNWIINGGSILLLGDRNGLGGDGLEHLNYISQDFNMTLGLYNELDNVVASASIPYHPTMEGCASILVSYRNYIEVTWPAQSIWEYSGNSVAAAQSFGEGRVAMLSDMNILDNGLLPDQSNFEFAVNLVNWLSASQADLLLYTDDPYDSDVYRSLVTQALNRLEIPFYLTWTEQGLNSSLYSEDWDFVIVDNCNYQIEESFSGLLHYLQSGGRLLMSTWNIQYYVDNPLWPYMGVAYSENWPFDESANIWNSEHPIFNSPYDFGSTTLNISGALFVDDGDQLTVFANATPLAGLTESQEANKASIVLRNDGKTLLNSFLLNGLRGDIDDSAYLDGFELWVNQIAFMVLDVPVIDSPSDIAFEYGMTGIAITWNPSSAYPIAYTIEQNASAVLGGAWSGGSISIVLDDYTSGVYIFEATVFDSRGNMASDEVMVVVETARSPVLIDAPDNLQYTEGTAQHWLIWNFQDDYPDHYEVLVNNVLYVSLPWNGNTISLNFGGRSAGSYSILMVVYDEAGYSAYSGVMLSVIESTSTNTSTTTNPSSIPSNTTPFEFDFSILSISIMIGSAGVIVIVIVLIFRSKQSGTEYTYTYG